MVGGGSVAKKDNVPELTPTYAPTGMRLPLGDDVSEGDAAHAIGCSAKDVRDMVRRCILDGAGRHRVSRESVVRLIGGET